MIKNKSIQNSFYIEELSCYEPIFSYVIEGGDNNSFCAFKSIEGILYLIYSNKKRSIICYNLDQQKIITEIKNSHWEYINNLRHYFDKINKRDLIISISFEDSNLKLWNARDFECLLEIYHIYFNGYLSACLLNEYDQYYIITANSYLDGISGPIKIYDFNGTNIKEIKNSSENNFFI